MPAKTINPERTKPCSNPITLAFWEIIRRIIIIPWKCSEDGVSWMCLNMDDKIDSIERGFEVMPWTSLEAASAISWVEYWNVLDWVPTNSPIRAVCLIMLLVTNVLINAIPKEPPSLWATLKKLDAMGTFSRGTALIDVAIIGDIMKAIPTPLTTCGVMIMAVLEIGSRVPYQKRDRPTTRVPNVTNTFGL